MDFDCFVDPHTKEKLTLDGEVLATASSSYPVLDGIPRFVESKNYSEAFGLQWHAFRKTQLDSFSGTSISEDRLRASLGFPLPELRGMRVLDAGCGAGRFTEILLKHGAKVYAIDYSSAVEANAENNLPNTDLTLAQADIRSLPFKDQFFDCVVCLGVLQHTPSTKDSVAELVRVLKVGGAIACDHYKWHLGAFTSLYLVWWFAISRLIPVTRQLGLTDTLTRLFFPIHWAVRDSQIGQVLLRRISPINFYYGRYHLDKATLYEWARLDTHDRNTDHYKRHITRRGFEKLLLGSGVENVKVRQGGTGYLAQGRRGGR